jgi:hypothetical protein
MEMKTRRASEVGKDVTTRTGKSCDAMELQAPARTQPAFLLPFFHEKLTVLRVRLSRSCCSILCANTSMNGEDLSLGLAPEEEVEGRCCCVFEDAGRGFP